MVLGFARAGADVVIASRKLESCESLAREVEATTGRKAMAHACHVGDWQQVGDLADAASDRFGHVDVLVNNAGMSPLYPRPVDLSEELYDKVLAVNLKGPFRLTAAIGRRMAEGNGGSIINISSVASIRADALSLPYAAAKAGLNALTEGFAQAYAPKVRVNAIMCGPFLTDIAKAWPAEVLDFVEAGVNAMTEAFAQAYGPKVRVNCIMPGPFLTDISKAWDLDAFNQQAKRFALRRGGEPEEIVGAAIYFASDASSYTTGAILRIDGGSGV
jgi:NAD(P)-dependent dehydrogenase (short-subunit alcohol dehydrogenase family)